MAGRKTKLTPERQNKIVELIREGNYIETACAASGICVETYCQWMRKRDRAPYMQFAEAIEKAQAEAEAKAVRIIEEAALTSWQAAAWYLERKYPSKWGRRVTVEGGSIEKPIYIANAKDELIKRLAQEDAAAEVEASDCLPGPADG